MCHDVGNRGDISTVTASVSVVDDSANAFQTIAIIKNTLQILTNLPEDLMEFQVTIESG